MKKKYVFIHPTALAHYRAQAFIVRCFDDRFRGVFEKFLTAKKIQHADVESVAGGAKIFASPERKSDREFMMRELKKSIRLHHTRRVMLFTHYDCGAYGGMQRFGNDRDKEFTYHVKGHRIGHEVIAEYFPEIKKIRTFFVNEKGIIETTGA